jgi:hypothetical protein
MDISSALKCRVDMQHGHTHGPATNGTQHGHAAWICCMDMQHEKAEWKSSMDKHLTQDYCELYVSKYIICDEYE